MLDYISAEERLNSINLDLYHVSVVHEKLYYQYENLIERLKKKKKKRDIAELEIRLLDNQIKSTMAALTFNKDLIA